MAIDWLTPKALMLTKGIAKTPTDNLSAEPDLIPLNLMSGAYTLTDWTPQIAPIKNSGNWADSPVTDGRTLISAAVGNVVEKIQVLIKGNGVGNINTLLSTLYRMAYDARDFWQSNYQVQPVYLTYYAACGVGEQYALIYNIDIATTFQNGDTPTVSATLTIEREPYWRGIPPGANPKLWSFYVNSQRIGNAGKTLADATLIAGSDHLISQSIQNKHEWTVTANGAQLATISKNYIDIPASLVPGDAPALLEVCVTSNATNQTLNKLFMALTARSLSGVNHAGATKANALILAAGDGFINNGAVKNTVTSANGVLSNSSAVNYTNVSKSLLAAATSYIPYITWGADGAGTVGPSILQLDRHFYSGRFAVFLRAFGQTEDTTQLARLTFSELEDATLINGNKQSVIMTDIPIPTNSSSGYNVVYCGTISLPFSGREAVAANGFGTFIRETAGQMYINLDLKNTSGGTRLVTILDLILMPIDLFLDEAVTGIGSSAGSQQIVIDSTGYLNHGDTGPKAITVGTTLDTAGVSAELRGQAPYLLPRMNQRLYFLATNDFTETSPPLGNLDIRLNIVPRWAGIRDA